MQTFVLDIIEACKCILRSNSTGCHGYKVLFQFCSLSICCRLDPLQDKVLNLTLFWSGHTIRNKHENLKGKNTNLDIMTIYACSVHVLNPIYLNTCLPSGKFQPLLRHELTLDKLLAFPHSQTCLHALSTIIVFVIHFISIISLTFTHAFCVRRMRYLLFCDIYILTLN